MNPTSDRGSGYTGATAVNRRGVGWAQSVGETFYPIDATGDITGVNGVPRNRTQMMKFTRMKSRAIVSDIISDPEVRLRLMGHKTGLNVLFADSSARWVNLDHIKSFLTKGDANEIAGFNSQYNPQMEQLWLRLDEAP